MNHDERVVFITVGSTRFDALITRVLAEDVVTCLRANGFERMVIQTGNSPMPTGGQLKKDDDGTFRGALFGIELEAWGFKPSLREEYVRAALVIGHAGSGTIIEVLRLGRKMIAVPNEMLLHNHQAELAEALDASGYLVSSRVQDLLASIDTAMSTTFQKFPDYDGSKFSSILDDEMGFSVANL